MAGNIPETASRADLEAHKHERPQSAHGIWDLARGYIDSHCASYVELASPQSLTLTNDGAWHDLDISAYVPASVFMVTLRCEMISDSRWFLLRTRPEGSTNANGDNSWSWEPYFSGGIVGRATDISGQLEQFLNSQKLGYKASFDGGGNVYITGYWMMSAGAAGGGGAIPEPGGVTSHSALTQLDYASSGHTGFEAAISILPVAKGGTGLDTVATNSYVKGAGAGALVPRTYAEVLSDIGAEPAIAAGTAAQVLAGDKTWQLPRLADVDLSNFLGLVWNEDRAANQILNLITGAADRTITLQGNPTLADWFDQAVKQASSPTHKELTLGPNDAFAYTKLILKSYFDSPTNAVPNVGGWLTAEGTGAAAYGPDTPGTKGTEWNMETAAFITSTLHPSDQGGACLVNGILLYADVTTGTIKGFNASDGSVNGATPSHGMINVRGICSDGTHFYIGGFLNGTGCQVKKYLLSNYSYVATWSPTWPTYMYSDSIQIYGGVIYVLDYGTKKLHHVNASTMATTGSSIDFPEYSAGNKYQMFQFVIDSTGTYAWAGGNYSTHYRFLKMNLSTLAIVTDSGDVSPEDSFYGVHLCYYKGGSEERIYGAGKAVDAYTWGNKANPSTCALYYSNSSLGELLSSVLFDGTYFYTAKDYTNNGGTGGVQRRSANTVWVFSTEAGKIRLWVNKLGVLTEAAKILSADLSLTIPGPFVSQVVTGTAPFQPTSTTVCPNLNADLLDGNQAAAFAVAGHTHAGVYEPVLGNPAGDGYVLASTALGVRSWVTPLVNPMNAVGDIIYGGVAGAPTKLADVAVGSYLRSGGVTTAPLWSTLILPNAATAYRLPVATGANTIGELAAVGATGEYLKGNTGAIPSWATLNQAAVAGLTTASSPQFAALNIIGEGPILVTTNTTDNTIKEAKVVCKSYDIDEENLMIVYGYSTSAINGIVLGGGAGAQNAATLIQFLTAAAINTVSGTERMRISADGVVLIGATAVVGSEIFRANGAVYIDGAFGCNASTPRTKATVNAASTDLATVVALCNQIRTALVNNGICV